MFNAAYAAWIEQGAAADLQALMQQSLADLRRAVGGVRVTAAGRA